MHRIMLYGPWIKEKLENLRFPTWFAAEANVPYFWFLWSLMLMSNESGDQDGNFEYSNMSKTYKKCTGILIWTFRNKQKLSNFHGFQPPTPSWKAFLCWPWWILASKAYIHYGPWLLCPDEPLKHLFMASGSLQKAQNRPQNGQFSYFFLGGSGWILASKAYIGYGPWLLCPDEALKHLLMASGSLQKAQNRPQSGQFS